MKNIKPRDLDSILAGTFNFFKKKKEERKPSFRDEYKIATHDSNEDDLYIDLILTGWEDNNEIPKYHHFYLFAKVDYNDLEFAIHVKTEDGNFDIKDIKNGIDDVMEDNDDPFFKRTKLSNEQKNKIANEVYPVIKRFMIKYLSDINN